MTLYAITDEILTPQNSIFSQVESALIGGAKFVQLRDKNSSYVDALKTAVKLKELCDKYEAKFLVNDNIKLAKESYAHGVHLGADDDDIKKARDILGSEAIIGASCYASIELAVKAQLDGATYAAFGAFFTSATKPLAKVAPLGVIEEAKKAISLPACAIGGINLTNMHLLKNADMIAVIGALWNVDDVIETARRFARL